MIESLKYIRAINSIKMSEEEKASLLLEKPFVKKYSDQKSLMYGLYLYLNNNEKLFTDAWKVLSSGEVWRHSEECQEEGTSQAVVLSIYPLTYDSCTTVGFVALKNNLGKLSQIYEKKPPASQQYEQYEQDKNQDNRLPPLALPAFVAKSQDPENSLDWRTKISERQKKVGQLSSKRGVTPVFSQNRTYGSVYGSSC